MRTKVIAYMILLPILVVVAAQSFGGERIERARIETTDAGAGPLMVSVGGKESKVANDAVKVWILDGGQRLVYAGRDGAGGYENEGQSLRLYEPGGKPRKILAETFAIDEVQDVKTSTGKEALLVFMSDGGLGASHLAVVDPTRGEVFAVEKAKLIQRDGDTLVVGFFQEQDWEPLNSGTKVKPYRTERYDLKQLLGRPLMTHKRAM